MLTTPLTDANFCKNKTAIVHIAQNPAPHNFLSFLTGSILKDAKGSQGGSRHDSNNCEKDGEGGNQGTGAVAVRGTIAVACGCSAAACPWVHRVAVVRGAPGEEWGNGEVSKKQTCIRLGVW